MKLIRRFFRPSNGSFFLSGPRGTGKSTWLRELFKGAFFGDLLGGRAVVRYMHPFMAGEPGEKFSLDVSLRIGLVPLVLFSSDPNETLRAYVTLYIHEEVKTEGLVRNIGGFARFLEAIAFSHASVLNMTDVARDCQVKRKSVEGYISVLEDLHMAFKVPVFTSWAKRQMSAHPKFYLFDAGVFRALRRTGPLDISREAEGAALEGVVAQHLRAWIDYGHRDCQLYFWRTRAGNEVDFVVYGLDTFVAIEVKNVRQLRNKDLTGLVEFQKDYPEALSVLLYRGKEILKIRGILCVPCEAFLRRLHPELSMSEVLKI